MSDYFRLITKRVLTANDPALLQVGFEATVLERYRESGAFQVMRTETVGRVKKQGGFSIDFGISAGEATIHASWQALTASLPAEEREHWAAFGTPSFEPSEMFLKMQLSPHSCLDDGELRAW